MYSNGGIQPFHGIDMDWFMELIWTGPWNPYGLLYYFDQVFMSCVTSPSELNTCDIITGHSWF